MSDDLYAAWLSAGNNLQPVVGWAVAHWWLIPTLAPTAFAAWAIRRELRDASKRVDDILADRPEPGKPGHNEDDLLICLQILAATNNAPKGDAP